MLSKSQYIRGLQCHKSLWLYKNKPELRSEPEQESKVLFKIFIQVGCMATWAVFEPMCAKARLRLNVPPVSFSSAAS